MVSPLLLKLGEIFVALALELSLLLGLQLTAVAIEPLGQSLTLLRGQPQLMELAGCDLGELALIALRNWQLVVFRRSRAAQAIVDLAQSLGVLIILRQHHGATGALVAHQLLKVLIAVDNRGWIFEALLLDVATGQLIEI
ncbi:hypothetical protein D9M71_696040 [compost metagenome]